MRRMVWVAAAALVALLSACGSTVQSSAPATQAVGVSGDQGLSAGASGSLGAGSGTTGMGGQSSLGSSGSTSGAVGGAPGGGPTSGGSNAASGGAAASGGTAPAPASASHGPIELGVLYAVNDGADSAGVQNGNTFTLSRVVHAFVDSYNSSGGVAGRHIDPVYAELHSASNDYESQIAAACASFTQDHHVAAVVSNVQYYSEQLMTCLAKASVPLISGDFTGPDQQDANRFPAFLTPTTMVGETRVTTVIDHLKSAGWLTSHNRIGVVIEDCPVDQRIFHNGVAPTLSHDGLTMAATFATQCFQSLQDFGTETSQMSNAVVQFRSKAVDRVMFVSQSAEANLAFAFSEVADNQGWHPGYALSSVSLPEALAQNAPASQLANMKGVGWLPVFDTEGLQQAAPDAVAKACLARMRSQGVQPRSNTDYGTVYGPCDSFGLLDSILRATNGDATLPAVLQGERKVAGSFQSSSTVGGRERVWAGGRIGAASGRLFAFVKGRFAYTSAPFAL